ncbi:hypothetical protein [Methylocystis heyeri]|uniref:hypothetical protein n=1 Tax=Methylocystis heyeri TaxID=391905 RepID=UPI001FE5D053|nr:hypothetical protein [Methylocystis heyeri]
MRNSSSKRIGLAALFVALGLAQATAEVLHRPWPDAFLSRLELLALEQTLGAELLASPSATATLEHWCSTHHMAQEPRLVARRAEGAEKAPDDEIRQRLQADAGEVVKYRRVRLSCGEHVLSEADNWYVPSRLPQDVNRLLETTDTPFGKAVRALQPYRRAIGFRTLWSPLPEGWEMQAHREQAAGAEPLSIPREIFELRAVLFTADQKPFSEVHETYTSEIFDFSGEPPVRP